MSFEDKLREQFHRADASVPGDRLDWNKTITTARRERMRYAALTAAAAVSVIGIGAYVLSNADTGREVSDPARGGTPSVTPTQTPSPRDTSVACSASDVVLHTDFQQNAIDLPQEVWDKWAAIIDAGVACDYETLEDLALAGRQGFQYSYSVEDSPSSFWRARERDARKLDRPTSEYMRYLVEILQLPFCKESQDDGTGTDTEAVYYVWPRAHCADHRTDEDWDEVQGLYTGEQIEMMRSNDLYYGFRVGILEDGDWVYFVAGD